MTGVFIRGKLGHRDIDTVGVGGAESHLKIEANIREVYLQAKECLGLLSAIRNCQKQERILPQSLRKEQ